MNLSEEIKELVIARLDTLSPDKKISIGSFGEFTKEQIIQHVQKGDSIGNKMIEIEMEFLCAIKDGLV
jgi:hypothetical protein